MWCTLVNFPYTVKPVLSDHSKRRPSFQDRLSLNAGQKYCKMLQGEHSTILLTFIKLPFVIKIFVFEWPLKTGFTVTRNEKIGCKALYTQMCQNRLNMCTVYNRCIMCVCAQICYICMCRFILHRCVYYIDAQSHTCVCSPICPVRLHIFGPRCEKTCLWGLHQGEF